MPNTVQPENLDAVKRAYRAEVRERRRNISTSQRASWAQTLTENLQQLVQAEQCSKVSCYLPTLDEPDTRAFVRWAHDSGIRVLLPISREDGLLDWVASDGTETEPGLYGIDEPVGAILSPMAVNEVDLMLIPASGVDAVGNRTGWGRGYFDKTLGSMDNRPLVFAVIFDDEFVDALPADLHDQPVDGVVTPSRIHRF